MSTHKNKKEENQKKNQNIDTNNKAKKVIKPSLKEELKKANIRIESQQRTIETLERRIIASDADAFLKENSFKKKALSFQKDAQKKIEKFKQEYRKKSSDEIKHIKEFAIEPLVNEITGPLINLELAIKAGKSQGAEVKNYVVGFEMILGQINQTLKRYGVSYIKPNVGEIFNHDLHEAISVSEGKKNTILEIKKPGIKLHNRVLIPATVIVGKG